MVFSIFGGRDADLPLEGAAQRVGVGEAAMGGDLLGRFGAFLQEPARGFDPHALDPGRRRNADLATKQA
jgi:hypothetical protein